MKRLLILLFAAMTFGCDKHIREVQGDSEMRRERLAQLPASEDGVGRFPSAWAEVMIVDD